MRNPYLKLLPPFLLFTLGTVCLYLLVFTNWFEIHKIPYLLDFHLYIIFTAFIISSVFYFKENIIYLLWHVNAVYIHSEKSWEEKEILVEELIGFFSLEKIRCENDIYETEKKIFGSKQTIFIEIEENYFFLHLEFSWRSYLVGNKFLNRLGSWVYNKASL